MIIYLSILLILLFCILVYDIRGEREYKSACVRLILLILILVSGFSYRLGGDGIGYTYEYKQYGDITDVSYSYLMGFNGRMPGWVLLCTLCKSITSSYWLFKLVHAIILNCAYVSAIRCSTKYTFTSLLVYFVLLYFNQNFQVLRESLAIAFFLFSLPSFYNNKWIHYYVLIVLAISFHIGAAFLLFFPLVKIIGFSKYSIIVYLALFAVIIFNSSAILEYLVFSSRETDVSYDGFYYYFHNATESDGLGFVNALLNLILPFAILVYYKLHNLSIKYLFPVLCSLGIYTLSTFLPIVYRFNNYLLIFNYILITDFIFYWFLNKYRAVISMRIVAILLFLIFYVGIKGRFYFTLNYGDTKYKQYVQYYPYASIFDKSIDPDRERLYKMIENY